MSAPDVTQGSPRRGLYDHEAARYIGLGKTTFLEQVANGEAPKPKRVSRGRLAWDIRDLDAHFDNLPYDDDKGDDKGNPFV